MDEKDETPLYLAAKKGNWNVCSLLIEETEKVSLKEKQLLFAYYKQKATKDILKPDKDNEMKDLSDKTLARLEEEFENPNLKREENGIEDGKLKTSTYPRIEKST